MLDLSTNRIHLFIAVSVLEWQRLVLSLWSKSFSRSSEKIFRACWSWCSASGETHIYLRPTARVYELNLNWHIENLFLSLHLIQFQTSNFQFLPLGCISKNQKNRCSCCFCYSVVLPPRIRQTSGDFSCTAYLSSMLFLTIFGETIFQLIK